MTPLHIASQKGRVEVVKELLNFVHTKYKKNKEGKTPFHVAQEAEKWEVMKVLAFANRLYMSNPSPGMMRECI